MNIDITMIFVGITLLITGAVIYVLLRKPFLSFKTSFVERAPLIKKYWLLVIPLVFITAAAYVCVYLWSPTEIAFGLVGQVSGLALGIIAGYIAFTELGENRFDKLADSGMNEFRAGRLKSAEQKLEEAFKIKSNDMRVLANLMELYLILGQFDKFDLKVNLFKKYTVEEEETLSLYYLFVIKQALQDRPKDTKDKIRDLIKYVADHPNARVTFNWRDDELKNSESYKLLSSESKTLAKNTLDYAYAALSRDSDARFAAGDYLLKSKDNK